MAIHQWKLALILVAVASAAGAQEVSRAVQQGIDKGFKSCAPVLDRYVRYAHSDDSKYAHLGTWSKTDTDQKMFNTLTVQPYTDGAAFAVFSAVKNQSGRCDAVVTQVFPVPGSSCTSVRETTFKSWKYLQELGGVPLFEPPGDESTTVLLAPLAPNGCLVIKHAVGYE